MPIANAILKMNNSIQRKIFQLQKGRPTITETSQPVSHIMWYCEDTIKLSFMSCTHPSDLFQLNGQHNTAKINKMIPCVISDIHIFHYDSPIIIG